MSDDGGTSLTLRRRLKAPPERVFEAWTDPAQLMRWFGPAGAEMLEAKVELVVGGRFYARFVSPGPETDVVEGRYLEIEPHRRLAIDWFWASNPGEGRSVLTVEIRPDGDGALLTLTHARLMDEPTRDGHRDGWSGSLDRLAAALA